MARHWRKPYRPAFQFNSFVVWLNRRVSNDSGTRAVIPARLHLKWVPDGRDNRLAKQRRPKATYFGGCSSLLNQPLTSSVFNGSGRSHSKH